MSVTRGAMPQAHQRSTRPASRPRPQDASYWAIWRMDRKLPHRGAINVAYFVPFKPTIAFAHAHHPVLRFRTQSCPRRWVGVNPMLVGSSIHLRAMCFANCKAHCANLRKYSAFSELMLPGFRVGLRQKPRKHWRSREWRLGVIPLGTPLAPSSVIHRLTPCQRKSSNVKFLH